MVTTSCRPSGETSNVRVVVPRRPCDSVTTSWLFFHSTVGGAGALAFESPLLEFALVEFDPLVELDDPDELDCGCFGAGYVASLINRLP